ncbi:MAG: nucleotidyltransferase domain-containing protein [candidate division WOR-3 bacterium]|nr:nucleotidyltransferase domain-containing protein [candidate division WOR-3 bacterium]
MSAVNSAIRSPAEVRAILAELRLGLESLYGDRLRGLYLFGSYARGEAEPESDIDVLIVLDDVSDYPGEVNRTGFLASELSLRHGLSLSRVFLSRRAWTEGADFFVKNVRQEGIAA